MTNSKPKAVSGHRGGLLALIAVLIAGGIAAYGIWSRSEAVAELQKTADDSALPRVQVMSPKPGPAQRTLILPGNIDAWFEAPIYAQVSGYVSHWYKDYGALVKEGDVLADIDTPSLDAQFAASKANLAVVQARYRLAEVTAKRWQALSGTQAVSQQDVDVKTADAAEQKAQVAAAQQDVARYQALIAFKQLKAPFDGVVSAHLVSVGELVGAASPTQLATIVALDPIYVNFNVNEQDVLRVRQEARRRGLTSNELRTFPIEVGLQTDSGYPHKGNLDYAAPTLTQSTGTLAVRGVLPNPDRVLLPGYYVRVRVPFEQQANALLVPDVALGSDQAGRYVLVVNGENVVEQRKVRTGPLEGDLRVIESGLEADDRVVTAGLLRAIPGQKVDPQLTKSEASPAPAKQDRP